MTRENKLALVVGFGLILLVGILISDHFSLARNQAAAQLTQVIDPLGETADAPADLIALRPHSPPRPRTDPGPAIAPPPPGARPDDHGGVRSVPAERRDDRAAIEMGGLESPAAIGLDPGDAERLPYTVHVVSAGESLSSICAARFADRSLAVELARYNELADPDRVRIGKRLRIPSAADLVRGRPAPAHAPPSAPAAVAASPAPRETSDSPRTYTVKEGDVLSEIASRLLGSSRKYLVIYEHNRDILDSPDAIQAGMTLRIPHDSS
jgi:nucleoid-associated protein YgaU